MDDGGEYNGEQEESKEQKESRKQEEKEVIADVSSAETGF